VSNPIDKTHAGSQALKHWDPNDRWYKPAVSAFVVLASRFTMRALNKVVFEGKEHWDEAFADSSRGVLSFSNHVSLFDDPLLISNLGAIRYDTVRWIPADHANFFGNRFKGWLFSCGKCVPIIRGGGLDQPGFSFLLEKLRAGDWVHIFPEGGRTRNPEGRLHMPFKAGIGRLLTEAEPTVVPFYHHGMSKILPIGGRFPRVGHEVQVKFGPPTRIDPSWLAEHAAPSMERTVRWRLATTWAESQLQALEVSVRR
jgi:monolysocardiolipin acyltransferase